MHCTPTLLIVLCGIVCDYTYSHYNDLIVIYDDNSQLKSLAGNFQQDNDE